jgi:pseudaminic acid biosynthesis-associated methylase
LAEFNEQEEFWANQYSNDYISKNSDFDRIKGEIAWRKMLRKTKDVKTVLECGSNIGRNIEFLNQVAPNTQKSIIEISKEAFEIVSQRFRLEHAFNGTILEADFDGRTFDLVFSAVVLIHIEPNNLLNNMQKMFELSDKYILIGEYFSRTPTMIEYQGQSNKLFKCDFGKLFLENFSVNVLDYGFLWGVEYDDSGFDDVTWWLFEKKV